MSLVFYGGSWYNILKDHRLQNQWIWFNIALYFVFIADPRITKAPFNLGADISTNASLPCEAVGDPTPKIYWLFKGNPIKTGGRFNQDKAGNLFVYSRWKMEQINEILFYPLTLERAHAVGKIVSKFNRLGIC